MSFINKDVNKTLIVLLVSLIVIMAGLEVFYALNFKSINTEYEKKVGELNSTYNSLVQYQDVLNTTKSELQLKTEREQGLSAQYSDVKTQKDSLQTQRDQLVIIKNTLESTLATKNDELSRLTTTYVALNRTYFAQRTQIEQLNSQVSSLQTQLTQCQAQ